MAEVWFDEPQPEEGIDVVFFSQRSQPDANVICREKYTLVSDLTQTPEALFASINKDTRNEIRRARNKDGVGCESALAGDSQTMTAFCDFYDRFANQKGLARLVRSRMQLYAASGMLDLSLVKDKAGEVIVWHAHLVGSGRARLLYSASLFRDSEDSQRRNLIGRANRCLLWEDMIRFQSLELAVYDFGGLYAGSCDKARLSINRFKEEFGGRKLCEFNYELPLTYKGRVALWIYRRLGKGE